ncbi:MAG: hypothetical protein E7Z65_06870 [Thermoplasmata archaeon]|nr:hypothetical protein [Thermoplasmata archaeon]
MIEAPKKGKTVKKIVKLPDNLIREIDENAIGFYTSRSEFVSEAIRNLTRKRLREDRDFFKDHPEGIHDFDDINAELMQFSQGEFFKLMNETAQYYSDIYSPVTVYIPEIELSYIEMYTGKDRAIRNLQEYARLAAAISINDLKKELELGFEIKIEEYGGRPTITVYLKE